jgi:hypothetical protein
MGSRCSKVGSMIYKPMKLRIACERAFTGAFYGME